MPRVSIFTVIFIAHFERSISSWKHPYYHPVPLKEQQRLLFYSIEGDDILVGIHSCSHAFFGGEFHLLLLLKRETSWLNNAPTHRISPNDYPALLCFVCVFFVTPYTIHCAFPPNAPSNQNALVSFFSRALKMSTSVHRYFFRFSLFCDGKSLSVKRGVLIFNRLTCCVGAPSFVGRQKEI